MDKLRVTIPNKCTQEIKYVLHCIFDVFLGLDYIVDLSSTIDVYDISYGDQSVIIENHFFTTDDLSKLYNKETIPSSVVNTKCIIESTEYPFISMFGNEEVTFIDRNIRIKSDIIASIYYMLSRWEEKVITDRDEHDRFEAKSSLAFRHDFLGRPIVNEYVELIWNAILYIGYDKERKERSYSIVPTHDIDDPLMWMNSMATFRSLMFSLVKAPSISDLGMKLDGILRKKDPYDSYDLLMDMAEQSGVKARFYFLDSGKSKYDRDYSITDPTIVNIIDRVLEREHIVGIHPSYNTSLDTALLVSEKSRMRSGEITYSRQHYLKVSVPDTWSVWENSGITYDSTMGYADVSGFRCGVCYPFPLFDCERRRQLSVIEYPLLVMDVTLKDYEKRSAAESIERINELQYQVKKYEGDFVFLWHNSSFNTAEWKQYEVVFNSLYNS